MLNSKDKIILTGKTILITGSPGFIGANLVLRLLQDKEVMQFGRIISFDKMTNYYDIRLKQYRLSLIKLYAKNNRIQHIFVEGDIADKQLLSNVFNQYKPDIVVNLAGQAGVRYSINHPDDYISSNIVGFYNILEACRQSYRDEETGVSHLIYASSSSVYGGNTKVPFSIEDRVDFPVSLYAATKKSNELLSYSYAKLYGIPSTGLRFFTVYGPAGRPDMFYYSATQKLLQNEKIKIYNYGNMERDFTYVDDIVEGIVRVMQGAPKKLMGKDGLPIAPFSLYNIGGGTPVKLLDFIDRLQKELVRAKLLPINYAFEAHRTYVGMQAGDVPITYADSSGLEDDYGFKPNIDIGEGLRRFCEWYKEYYEY